MALDVLAVVPMGSQLRLATSVVGHRRIWARRLGEFRLPAGELAARAVVDWVLLDERGRILRIPPDFGAAFPNPELDGEIIRVALPATVEGATAIELQVRPQDLDPMGHVNNAAYLDWIEETILAAGDSEAIARLPRHVEIEYAASAEPGDGVIATAWRHLDAWSVRISRVGDGLELVRATIA